MQKLNITIDISWCPPMGILYVLTTVVFVPPSIFWHLWLWFPLAGAYYPRKLVKVYLSLLLLRVLFVRLPGHMPRLQIIPK